MTDGTSAPRAGDWMQTYSGLRFWPIDPRPGDIDIEDIAHALAMQCRYGGHGKKFYSVAEHCVLMARHTLDFGPEIAMWALLHDASEAYIVDIPRPLKPWLANYKDHENRVMRAIARRFDLVGDMPAVVHDADQRIIADERMQNLVLVPWDHEPGPAIGVTLEFWSPVLAELHFMSMYRRLDRERAAFRAETP